MTNSVFNPLFSIKQFLNNAVIKLTSQSIVIHLQAHQKWVFDEIICRHRGNLMQLNQCLSLFGLKLLLVYKSESLCSAPLLSPILSTPCKNSSLLLCICANKTILFLCNDTRLLCHCQQHSGFNVLLLWITNAVLKHSDVNTILCLYISISNNRNTI